MVNRYLYIALLSLASILLASCTKDYLESFDDANYSKLYRASEDIEAVDFILKPDNSGFLILGNSKTINSAEPNSNLILFNVDFNGFIISQKELLTNFYDEGQALYPSVNNEVYIVGKRSIRNGAASTILVKTDINGELTNYNDTALYENIREIKYNPNWTDVSYVQQDLNIVGDILIMAGYIAHRINSTTAAVARTYSLNELFQNYETTVAYNDQIPLETVIPTSGNFNNSKFVKLTQNNLSDFDLNIYGVKSNSNGDKDILNYIIQDVNEFRYQSPSLSIEGSQNLKTMTFNEVDNSVIYVGNNAGANSADSLFILRGIYNADAAKDSVGFDVLSNNTFNTSQYGNEIIDITQNSNGEVFIITTKDERNNNNNEVIYTDSYVLKFSFTVQGKPIEVGNFNIVRNGFHSAKKIKYHEASNAFYILSSIQFNTEETAIELNKVRF